MTKYTCKYCNYNTNDSHSLEKHNWINHPSNEYERMWSNLYKSGKLSNYSLAYQDDPYY